MLRILLKNNQVKILNFFTIKKSFLSTPPQNGIEIFINNQKIVVNPGTTIMQAATMLGIEIPRFCYHNKLSIAGNCRMCLVEVEKMPKPIASCAMPVMNGWKIFTDSNIAKKAREGVMELLLINHPLDCPICDQGGECDLQDQSMAHGNDKSRFIESMYTGKRAVENKDLGPLVKTVMTRCIHCTRCIRFMTEIAGVEDLGSTGRGNDMEIGTYIDKMLKSELSGNIIDVCPVGALTSKPNQFAVRPWEMTRFESIDISDAVGSNITVGVRTSDVMRILPSPNDEINEDWISDKARFMYDGLKYQRLMVPLVLEDGRFKPVDWESALIIVARNFLSANKNHSYAIAGQLMDAESLVTLRDLFHSFFCENIFTEDRDHPNLETGVDFRCSYTMNSRIQDIEDADVLLLVGICPRYESTLINARIRKGFIHKNLKVLLLGEETDLTYPYEYVGNNSASLINLFSGNHQLSPILLNAKQPMILLGTNSSQEEFGPHLLQKLLHFSNSLSANLDNKDWKVFNSIQRNAGYVNALDLGYNPKLPSLEKAEFIYLLGTDSGLIKEKKIDSSCFVVYQGHHGDLGAQLANIILPGSAYTEKSGIYVNTEGRAQMASRCVTPPGNAREDWKIIRALSEVCGKPLSYQTIYEVRSRLAEIAPHFCKIGDFQPSNFQELTAQVISFRLFKFNESNYKLDFESLNSRINNLADFYMTDSISRHSKTMAKCVFEVLNKP